MKAALIDTNILSFFSAITVLLLSVLKHISQSIAKLTSASSLIMKNEVLKTLTLCVSAPLREINSYPNSATPNFSWLDL